MSRKKQNNVIKCAGYKQANITARKEYNKMCADFLAELGRQMIESNKTQGCKRIDNEVRYNI